MSYQFGHVDRDERIDLAADEPLGEVARRNGLPTPLLTALVMAVFAGGLWIAYDLGEHHAATAVVAPGAVPLIRADSQPMKVKPDQPGGLPVPARDRLIYNEEPGGPPVEKLLPPPEQPAPPRVAAVAPTPLTAAPLGPDMAAATAPAPLPPRHKPVPYDRDVAAVPDHDAPASDAAPREAAPGAVRIQLASVRSVEAARIEWQRLKRANPALLGRLGADAVRDDLGARGIYYRVLAGSFAHPAAAARLCRQLRQHRVECSVVR